MYVSVPSGLITAVPLVGIIKIVGVPKVLLPLGSLSFPLMLTVTRVLGFVIAKSLTAIGAKFVFVKTESGTK